MHYNKICVLLFLSETKIMCNRFIGHFYLLHTFLSIPIKSELWQIDCLLFDKNVSYTHNNNSLMSQCTAYAPCRK